MNRIGFSQRLELRQSQALVMTPQLQQAIKMLQLSNIELADFVEAEIEQNPLLERGEREGEDAAPNLEPDAEAAAANGASEALPETRAGDRAGQHSIRINDQWRVCFRWREGDAYEVEIADYH